MEHWLHSHFDGEDALVRPEWSKGWAYKPDATWKDAAYIEATVPESHTQGRPRRARWNTAVRRLDKLDPQRVFSNDFLDQLLQRR